MGGTRKRARVGAAMLAAALIAVSLTGCTSVSEVGYAANAATAAQSLGAKLRGMSGVTSADATYSPDLNTGGRLRVAVTMRKSASDNQWSGLAEALRSGMLDKGFASSSAKGTARAAGAALTLTRNAGETAAQLRSEVSRWRAIQTAAGTSVNLTISPAGRSGSKHYLRDYRVPGDTAAETQALLARWRQVSAVSDATHASTTWETPGLWFTGPAPSVAEVAPAKAVFSAIPPDVMTDATKPAVAIVSWDPTQGATLNVTAQTGPGDMTTPVAQAIRSFSLMVSSRGSVVWSYFAHTGRLSLGDCPPANVTAGTPDDKELLSAVVAKAGPVTPSVTAGSCIRD